MILPAASLAVATLAGETRALGLVDFVVEDFADELLLIKDFLVIAIDVIPSGDVNSATPY